MKIRKENQQRRENNVAKMEEQLHEWSLKLDELVVGYIKAGAHAHDQFRLQVDDLRARHAALESKLDAFKDPTSTSGSWDAFRETVGDAWTTLETGFKEIGR